MRELRSTDKEASEREAGQNMLHRRTDHQTKQKRRKARWERACGSFRSGWVTGSLRTDVCPAPQRTDPVGE